MHTEPQPIQQPAGVPEAKQQPSRLADPHVDGARALVRRMGEESGQLGRPPSVFVHTTGTRDEKTVRLPGGRLVTTVFTDTHGAKTGQEGQGKPLRGVEISRSVGRWVLEAGITVDDEQQTRTAEAKVLLGRLSLPLPPSLAGRIVGRALEETRERHDAPIIQQVAALDYQRWQADWRSQHGDEPDIIVEIGQRGQRGTQWVHADQIPAGATELSAPVDLASTEYADLPEALRRYNEMGAEAAIQVVRAWVHKNRGKAISADRLSMLASNHYTRFIKAQRAARNPRMYVDPEQPEHFRQLPDFDKDGHPYEGGREEYREWIRCAATVLGVTLDEEPELKPDPKPHISDKIRIRVQ